LLSGTVLPCAEQGIRNAIAAGDGRYTFDCDGTTPVVTQSGIEISNDVILDGEGRLTVDGNCDHVLFSVAEGVTAELRGFAVTRGYDIQGGGIRNDGTLTVADSTVTRCSTAPSFLMVDGSGGGIFNAATLTVSDSTISENAADFSGGGVRNDGALTLTDSIVSGNSAGAGGGIWNWESFTMTNSTVSGNTARSTTLENAGGGIHNRGSGTITKSTVSANTGAGVYSQVDPPSGLTITHSTVSGNTSHGFRNHSGTLMLTNVTVSGSISAGSGGDEVSSVMAHGTLLDGACTSVEGGVGVSAWTSFGYNVESPGDTCGFDQTEDQPGVTEGELNLGALADNDGPTLTHKPGDGGLGEGSVAIDAIALDACFDTEGDQRGEPRPETGGTMCDAGSVEVQADE
jgi:hypothetical protein